MHLLLQKTYRSTHAMKNKFIPLLLASTAVLTACDNANNTAPTATPNAATAMPSNTPAISRDEAIAVVNGTYISKKSLADLEQEIMQRTHGQPFPRERLIEDLVRRELLFQDAQNKQLQRTPEFSRQLENIKKALLSQAVIEDYLNSHPITDAELQAEYDKNVNSSGQEYKARHILLKTEDDAKAVIVELDNGADFVELAKTKSTGPSGPQGGDLGWFSASQMVPPFSEATIALEDGAYSKEPVETQFGWHVILREGSRTPTPPPFDAIKEQIRPQLQQQKIQDYLNQLQTQAKIEIFPEPAKPEPIQSQPESDAAPASESDQTIEVEPEVISETVTEEVITEPEENTEQAPEESVEEQPAAQ